MKLPLDGTCRCGALHIRLTAPPIITAACHCPGCQRMSSSAFSLTAIAPTAGFAVTQGEPVLGGLRGKDLQHFFCGACMTWMFSRPAQLPDFVNVRPTMFDDTSWFAPFIETYTKTKLPFAQSGAVRSFDEFPPMESFGSLLAEYAAWHAKRSA